VLKFFTFTYLLTLFYVPGIPDYGQSFPVFFLGGIMLSVAMAWLYGHSGGSLSLAMLMHSAVNQTNGIVPTRSEMPGNPLAVDTSPITLLTIAVGLATGGYFLARMPRASRVRYPVE
jgi:membrane protease YdiL (CAAX protease family)